MRINVDVISKWTVNLISNFYYIIVSNFYFILSNIIGAISLLIFKLTMNNFLFFIIPIYLFLISYIVQFKLLEQKETISFKNFIKMYISTFKQNWKIICLVMMIILFLFFDIYILSISKAISYLTIPVLLTSIFILNSFMYLFLIQTKEEASQLTFRKKLTSCLLLSYKLPRTTIVNSVIIVLLFFSLYFLPTMAVTFLIGFFNSLIFSNLQRRFSIDLYFDQVLNSTL